MNLLLPLSQFLACAVCFGNPDSLQSKALGLAVFFLLGTVGAVLGGIAVLALTWMRRSKKLSALSE